MGQYTILVLIASASDRSDESAHAHRVARAFALAYISQGWRLKLRQNISSFALLVASAGPFKGGLCVYAIVPNCCAFGKFS